MRDPAGEQLRDSFNRELQALAAEAAHSNAPPPADRVEALVHLASLIQIRESSRPARRRRLPALLLIVTLGAVSLLLFARVGETDIEIEASVGQLRFSLARDQALTETAELSSLGMSGLGAVEVPGAGEGSAPAVSLTAGTAGPRHGSVTLAPLILPGGSRVTLHGPDVRGQNQMSIIAPARQVQASVYGPVSIAVAGSQSRDLDFKSPKPVAGAGGGDDVELTLGFAAGARPAPVSPQLQVQNLSIFRIDQTLSAGQSLVRRISTIRSGTLYFESLNGQERHLRAGEELSFSQSQGELRTVELTEGRLDFKFRGVVRGMTTGAGEGIRSLMPTWLEWMQARHGLSLLWGTSLYVFGMIAVVLRWWGIKL